MFNFTPGQSLPKFENDFRESFITISNSLTDLLKQAQSLYNSMGISYEVTNLHNSLFRQLVPFELLAHFGLVNHHHLYKTSKQQRKIVKEENQIKIETFEQNVKNKTLPTSITSTKQETSSESIISNSFYQNESVGYSSNYVYKPNDYRRINRNSPVMTREQEKRLSDEIINRINHGDKITRGDICERAREITGITEFKGSSGWMNLFFNRHKDLKKKFEGMNKRKTGILNGFKSYGDEENGNYDYGKSVEKDNENESSWDYESEGHRKHQLYEEEENEDQNTYKNE